CRSKATRGVAAGPGIHFTTPRGVACKACGKVGRVSCVSRLSRGFPAAPFRIRFSRYTATAHALAYQNLERLAALGSFRADADARGRAVRDVGRVHQRAGAQAAGSRSARAMAQRLAAARPETGPHGMVEAVRRS